MKVINLLRKFIYLVIALGLIVTFIFVAYIFANPSVLRPQLSLEQKLTAGNFKKAEDLENHSGLDIAELTTKIEGLRSDSPKVVLNEAQVIGLFQENIQRNVAVKFSDMTAEVVLTGDLLLELVDVSQYIDLKSSEFGESYISISLAPVEIALDENSEMPETKRVIEATDVSFDNFILDNALGIFGVKEAIKAKINEIINDKLPNEVEKVEFREGKVIFNLKSQ